MYRDARPCVDAVGTRGVPFSTTDDSGTIERIGGSLAWRVASDELLGIEIDEGHTFDNRFLLVWHKRDASFRDVSYRTFWQEFARQACNVGPRVDDTLHVMPRRGREAEFWVIGGDGRLASHCANGLMYAADRYAKRFATTRVWFQCGRQRRLVRVEGGSAQVNLGLPRALPSLGRFPVALRRSPVLVNTGEPHAVSFGDELELPTEGSGDWFCELGQAVCRTGAPAGINFNLVTPFDDGFRIRTFERGVRRPTSSCGTGSAAAFHAARLQGRHDRGELAILSEGGRHLVSQCQGEILVSGRPSHDRSSILNDYLSAGL